METDLRDFDETHIAELNAELEDIHATTAIWDNDLFHIQQLLEEMIRIDDDTLADSALAHIVSVRKSMANYYKEPEHDALEQYPICDYCGDDGPDVTNVETRSGHYRMMCYGCGSEHGK